MEIWSGTVVGAKPYTHTEPGNRCAASKRAIRLPTIFLLEGHVATTARLLGIITPLKILPICVHNCSITIGC